MSRITLVLGGARSGKSRYAEKLVTASGTPWHYIATAQAFDDEMKARIAAHRAQRGEGWITHEAPLDIVGALRGCGDGVVLIDCITVWLGNLLHHGRDALAEVEALCAALAEVGMRVVIVANEVGLGIVPDNPLSRAFRDVHGLANQKLASLASEVVFVAAGLPLTLKAPER